MREFIDAATYAALGAGPVGLYFYCVRPALRWYRASAVAHLLAAGVGGLTPIAVAIAAQDGRLALLPALLTMLLLVPWFWPSELTRITGGPRPFPHDVDAVISILREAGDRLRLGDVDGFTDGVRRAEGISVDATDAYVGLWRQFMDEELDRRGGTLRSSDETQMAMGVEYGRLRNPPDRVPGFVAIVGIVLGGVVGASPVIMWALST